MRILKSLFFVCVLAIGLVSCSKKENPQFVENKGLPSSGGKTLEVVLVVPDEVYKGELKDSIGHYFMKPCEGMSQPEPWFDVVQLRPDGFFNSEMLQKHRNVMIVDLKAGNSNKLKSTIDYKAYPQAYFVFEVDNRDSLFSLLNRYSEVIKEQFYLNEHKRMAAAFKRIENTKITQTLKKKFGFWLTVSEEFYLATDKEDFVWLRKEPKDGSMSIMIHTKPFEGDGLFREEKIIELRDQIAKENIPGPARGSYMGTEKRFPLVRRNVKIGEYDAVETRGLWRLFGDWMGGSFINYCFEDKANKRFVMIDCFLYSPRHPKRDQLMQLESIVFDIKTK